MGLSTIMAFSLISVIAITLIAVILINLGFSANLIYNAENLKQSTNLGQLSSRITILSVTADSNDIYINVANNGSVTLWSFCHFAVIVKYYANVSESEELTISSYNYSRTPTTYQWTSSGILNPDSVVKFTVVLPYPPYADTNAVIIISTNYGTVAVWRGIL
ncbi:hypothetical protein [Acidianus sp. HS-5]|uniref:hypothetical protein n=1 Tax=Acidianus sp. HS-5 TaxID=2886040 RepID=UPI001F1B9E34|nr:hypothetical protein [Acidianus sp. HS-5]BDC17317.1 hypothetical protein HS5_02070 [Acidianus sp. HS-5]